MIATIKPIISFKLLSVDKNTISFVKNNSIEVDLTKDDFIKSFNTIKNTLNDYLIEDLSVTTNFLVVADSVVVANHPQKFKLNLDLDHFIQTLNDLLKIRNDLLDVNALMRTGNILSLGNVQATTLGVQSQYQFPTSVGSAGQAIGYQGVSQLIWRNGNQGPQGAQGNQGNQGFVGNQGRVGNQGNQGNQGTQGFQGRQGNQGTQGVIASGFVLPFVFNASTSMSAASGEARFNNTTISSVTNIDLSKTDRNGSAHQAVLDLFNTGTIFMFTADGVSNQYSFFSTTGVTKNSTDYNFSVSYISSLGSIFSSQNISLGIGVVGIVGVQGSQGFQGSVGSQGFQGISNQTMQISASGDDGHWDYIGNFATDEVTFGSYAPTP